MFFKDRRYAFKLAVSLKPKFIGVHDVDRKEEQDLIRGFLSGYHEIASTRVFKMFKRT